MPLSNVIIKKGNYFKHFENITSKDSQSASMGIVTVLVFLFLEQLLILTIFVSWYVWCQLIS